MRRPVRSIELSWGCPRYTRTFLLQQVLTCGDTNAKTDILTRYSKFSKGLMNSISKEVRVLFNLVARDLRSTTARNIKFVEAEAGTGLWTVGQYKLKQELHSNQLVDVNTRDQWRVVYLSSLLGQLHEARLHVQEDRMSELQ